MVNVTISYTYDGIEPDGKYSETTTDPKGNITTRVYDKAGRLSDVTADGETTTYSYYANGSQKSVEYGKVILETDNSNSQTARNVYGLNLISRTSNLDNLYYMYNGHADMTALITADGTIAATYYYDAFGTIIEQSGDVDNNITYAGYQYDEIGS